MKIDLFENKWLDIVLEGRNKSYGAYDLRKKNTSTNIRAFIIGAVIFAFAVATPMLMELIPDSSDEDTTLNDKIVTVKLPPKEEKPKENIPPPPPPPPTTRISQVIPKGKLKVPEVVKIILL